MRSLDDLEAKGEGGMTSNRGSVPWLQDADLTLYHGDVLACPCGCGETFSPVDSRGRPRAYFSPACSLRVNHRRGGWDGRKHSDETKALISEKASVPKPWLRGERNGMSGRTGASNPNWKGGATPERQALYASTEWREVARAVKRRDGGCVDCGSAAELHVHHVLSFAEYPELRLEPTNLQTLCRSCHYEKHKGGGANQ